MELTMLEESQIIAFAEKCGLGPVRELSLLKGGANNRVFCLKGEKEEYLLKVYFQHSGDSRDRFFAEQAFYKYLWKTGVHDVPEPLGWDEEKKLGLFAFVAGRKLTEGEIGREYVNQASVFIRELNEKKTQNEETGIGLASEACFSPEEHLHTVERRVRRLKEIQICGEIDREAHDFVQNSLGPCWVEAKTKIEEKFQQSGTIFSQPLDKIKRCLSPSDFGFHNALLTEEKRLIFFDFEYSGWDDPAKLVCDFFCQPELPVDSDEWEYFTETFKRLSFWDEEASLRAKVLFPVYQIKWCCIILNEFLSMDSSRRAFAGKEASKERKIHQLQKAKKAFLKIKLEN